MLRHNIFIFILFLVDYVLHARVATNIEYNILIIICFWHVLWIRKCLTTNILKTSIRNAKCTAHYNLWDFNLSVLHFYDSHIIWPQIHYSIPFLFCIIFHAKTFFNTIKIFSGLQVELFLQLVVWYWTPL